MDHNTLSIQQIDQPDKYTNNNNKNKSNTHQNEVERSVAVPLNGFIYDAVLYITYQST